MVAYNFQKRFVAPIRAGTKRQTIRAERAGRARHVRPGEIVQLYFGLRTVHCRRIAAPVCESVMPIRIHLQRRSIDDGGRWLDDSTYRLDVFAVDDGFTDWDDMVAFWRKHHPGILTFSGVVIRWAPIVDFDPIGEGRS